MESILSLALSLAPTAAVLALVWSLYRAVGVSIQWRQDE
jgi:hypothetical protein